FNRRYRPQPRRRPGRADHQLPGSRRRPRDSRLHPGLYLGEISENLTGGFFSMKFGHIKAKAPLKGHIVLEKSWTKKEQMLKEFFASDDVPLLRQMRLAKAAIKEFHLEYDGVGKIDNFDDLMSTKAGNDLAAEAALAVLDGCKDLGN